MTTSGSEQPVIRIKAIGKRNGLTISLVGGVAVAFSALLISWLPEAYRLGGIFLLSASFVTLLIGWFKLREPPFSFELTPECIHYRHRNGNWSLGWHNIQRIDTPSFQKGLEQKSMELVGIRIKDYVPLLDSISPRLASNLLMEQRPLLIQSSNCSTGTCYSENLLEEDRFKDVSGKQYTGIKAMLGNRMTRLRDALGYDLFVSVAELDRDKDAFVSLLRDCQQQVLVKPTAQ